jgi:hypothetical protein
MFNCFFFNEMIKKIVNIKRYTEITLNSNLIINVHCQFFRTCVVSCHQTKQCQSFSNMCVELSLVKA